MTRRLFALALLIAAPLSAQTYTAKTIQFSDLGPFTQAQLEAASGITAGTSFTKAQLAAAAQTLIDSGYFEDVGATVDGSVTAITVKFTDKPSPITGMLRVGFENFVWLTPDEITQAICTQFPLFIGYLPENSPHQDDIKTALTAALAAKSISVTVTYDEFEPTLRHPVREIAFSISRPRLRVANIKLTGVTPALVPLIQKSVNKTSRTAYTEGPADLTTADSVLEPLLDAGYIQAALLNPTPVATQGADGNFAIVLSATLSPGDIYHVSSLDFAGTPVITAAAFNTSSKLHAGDIASRKLLLETLKPIDDAYRNKGYLDVAINSNPKPDPTATTVAYTITVAPGEPYRIHEITAQNLTGAAKADYDRGFLMKSGDVYNPAYITNFLKNNTALRALEGYTAAFKTYADPATHQVDVVITWFAGK